MGNDQVKVTNVAEELNSIATKITMKFFQDCRTNVNTTQIVSGGPGSKISGVTQAISIEAVTACTQKSESRADLVQRMMNALEQRAQSTDKSDGLGKLLANLGGGFLQNHNVESSNYARLENQIKQTFNFETLQDMTTEMRHDQIVYAGAGADLSNINQGVSIKAIKTAIQENSSWLSLINDVSNATKQTGEASSTTSTTWLLLIAAVVAVVLLPQLIGGGKGSGSSSNVTINVPSGAPRRRRTAPGEEGKEEAGPSR